MADARLLVGRCGLPRLLFFHDTTFFTTDSRLGHHARGGVRVPASILLCLAIHAGDRRD